MNTDLRWSTHIYNNIDPKGEKWNRKDRALTTNDRTESEDLTEERILADAEIGIVDQSSLMCH